jgi:hypothetical protein
MVPKNFLFLFLLVTLVSGAENVTTALCAGKGQLTVSDDHSEGLAVNEKSGEIFVLTSQGRREKVSLREVNSGSSIDLDFDLGTEMLVEMTMEVDGEGRVWVVLLKSPFQTRVCHLTLYRFSANLQEQVKGRTFSLSNCFGDGYTQKLFLTPSTITMAVYYQLHANDVQLFRFNQSTGNYLRTDTLGSGGHELFDVQLYAEGTKILVVYQKTPFVKPGGTGALFYDEKTLQLEGDSGMLNVGSYLRSRAVLFEEESKSLLVWEDDKVTRVSLVNGTVLASVAASVSASIHSPRQIYAIGREYKLVWYDGYYYYETTRLKRSDLSVVGSTKMYFSHELYLEHCAQFQNDVLRFGPNSESEAAVLVSEDAYFNCGGVHKTQSIQNVIYDEATRTLRSEVVPSGLPVRYDSYSTVCQVNRTSGAVQCLECEKNCTVHLWVPGNEEYTPAKELHRRIWCEKRPDEEPTPQIFSVKPYTVNRRSGTFEFLTRVFSLDPPGRIYEATFSCTGACRMSPTFDTAVVFEGSGVCECTAHRSGNCFFLEAEPVSVKFCVGSGDCDSDPVKTTSVSTAGTSTLASDAGTTTVDAADKNDFPLIPVVIGCSVAGVVIGVIMFVARRVWQRRKQGISLEVVELLEESLEEEEEDVVDL